MPNATPFGGPTRTNRTGISISDVTPNSLTLLRSCAALAFLSPASGAARIRVAYTVPSVNDSLLRFDRFELDVSTGELRKGGSPLKLPPQPTRVLALLAQNAGRLVTREHIRTEVWRGDTFVDFEQGLNHCIKLI